MTINENGILLRVFIGESDRHQGKPLYEAIVQQARALGLAGATVLKGVEGFGANSVVHKASLLEMSTDLPMVIEMVDVRERVIVRLPALEPLGAEVAWVEGARAGLRFNRPLHPAVFDQLIDRFAACAA